MLCIVSGHSGTGVSILVVLDLALQPQVEAARVAADAGFNPCCIGFSVATGAW